MNAHPIKLVVDIDPLTTTSAASVATASTDAFIVRTGVSYVAVSTTRGAAHFAVVNDPVAAGIGSLHVNPYEALLIRYAHPAQAVVTGITTGTTTTFLTVNHTDTKLVVGDYVTMRGSAISDYNNQIKHVRITEIQTPQQWNGYICKIGVATNTATAAAFTGIATAYKSVRFLVAPETAAGTTVHIHEVQLG